MTRKLAALAALMLSAILFDASLLAQDAPADPSADQNAEVKKFIDSLSFESGTIALPEAKATLKLQSEMRFLRGHDAERVLTELWGNPPGTDPVGLLLPTAAALTDDTGYAVVVTYNDDG